MKKWFDGEYVTNEQMNDKKFLKLVNNTCLKKNLGKRMPRL